MLREIERATVGTPKAATKDAAEADPTLAGLVRSTLADLARHSSGHARRFADRTGARVAYHVHLGRGAGRTHSRHFGHRSRSR
jgi:hypothetical protein